MGIDGQIGWTKGSWAEKLETEWSVEHTGGWKGTPEGGRLGDQQGSYLKAGQRGLWHRSWSRSRSSVMS